ncbi:MAG: subtype B tannase [Coprococcus sp.]
MKFDSNQYTVEELTVDGETIRFRAFRDLVYVEHPVNVEFQKMNLYVPEIYYEGASINGYNLKTAPVFMPNLVGGYMPGIIQEPGCNGFGSEGANAVFRALQHGYVVAAPAIRGRTQRDEKGGFTGKAPACIIDYKAAVRYLHFFSEELPGDEDKIITNGTSAGGALSALMGATGNHPDYDPYLNALGAVDAGDEIFAASCYCPITNLEHADMAYEWQFKDVYDYHRMHMQMEEGGRPSFSAEDGRMTDNQIQASIDEAASFTEYVNGLHLTDENGVLLSLDEAGEGTFKKYIEQIVLASAQRAIEKGIDIKDKKWLTIVEDRAVEMDFNGYVRDITRMKTAPAFDALTMDSPENSLFGRDDEDCCHFTEYSHEHSECGGSMAEKSVVKVMNPMNYIGNQNAMTAKYWRIRHGECDRDTSLAISAILAAKLRNTGCCVDYHAPWDTPHSGDYDLEELFAWIDDICQ